MLLVFRLILIRLISTLLVLVFRVFMRFRLFRGCLLRSAGAIGLFRCRTRSVVCVQTFLLFMREVRLLFMPTLCLGLLATVVIVTWTSCI